MTGIPGSRKVSAFRLGGTILLATLVIGASPDETRAQRFTRVTAEAGIEHTNLDPHGISGGVAWFDYDGDGWDDLYLTGGQLPDHLYRNNRNGTFTDVTEEAGLDVVAAAWTMGVVSGDIDNDGDRDLFVTTYRSNRNILLRNNGDGTFTEVSLIAGMREEPVWSVPASFADIDMDGDLDLFVGNYVEFSDTPFAENLLGGTPNFLYRNRGKGTFEEVGQDMEVWDPDGGALASAFTDYDGDGDPDLYVANDFGNLFSPNRLFRNEHPEPRFTEVGDVSGTAAEINAMAVAPGDVDEDGDLDLYITNMANNQFYLNRGDGTFEERGIQLGINNPYSTSWGAAFFDADNDGRLELMWTNGRIQYMPHYEVNTVERIQRLVQPHADRMVSIRGDSLAFVEISAEAGVADTTRGRGMAYADYDRDGDLDFAVAVNNDSQETQNGPILYRNDTESQGSWIQLELLGTRSNRDAFGAWVEVHSGGRRWLTEMNGGSSYISQHSSVVHVGLGDRAAVDSVVVHWPAGGRQVVEDAAVLKRHRIVEPAEDSTALR